MITLLKKLFTKDCQKSEFNKSENFKDKVLNLLNQLDEKVKNSDLNSNLNRHDLILIDEEIKIVKQKIENIKSNNDDFKEVFNILGSIAMFYSRNDRRINNKSIMDDIKNEIKSFIFDDIFDALYELEDSFISNKKDLINEIEKSITPLLKKLDLITSKRGDDYKHWNGYGEQLLSKFKEVKEGDWNDQEIKNWLFKIKNTYLSIQREPMQNNDEELTNLISEILKAMKH